MSYLLQGIPSDIYNSVDAYKDAKIMWEMIKRLMHGCDKTEQVRHSRLMNEFDKFVAMEGESLTSMYESKYVTMIRQSQNLHSNDFDHLYDAFSQYEPHVNASKANKDARNHDPLALGDKKEIKQLMQEMVRSNRLMKMIRLLSEFYELSQIRERQMFNVYMLQCKREGTGNKMMAVARHKKDGKRREGYNDAIIMMAHIQPTNDNGNAEPKYDVDANHAKLNTVNTSDDDQIDSNNISDDPNVENNEAKNQQTINNELKKQKALLQKELEMCKEQVKTLEKKPIHFSKYQEACEELEREIRVDKDTIDRLLRFKSAKLKIDSPDYEETLEDAEESRLKMNDKMIQLDYEN
ncbi:hypothetical protein Tco_0385501 [Tanacetum coccineum]